jgi:hypothetical protein
MNCEQLQLEELQVERFQARSPCPASVRQPPDRMLSMGRSSSHSRIPGLQVKEVLKILLHSIIFQRALGECRWAGALRASIRRPCRSA